MLIIYLLVIFWVLYINPIPRRGGGAYMPPYHISAIFSGRTYPRRLQLYSKFKFCNYRTHKIGPGSKKFSYGAWEPAKVGWVVDFLLRFCLKIGCIFSFHEMRWFFLAEIELYWPQVLKQKIKVCSKFLFAKRIRGLAYKLEELDPYKWKEIENAMI